MKQFFVVLGVLLAALALIGWLVLGRGVADPLVPGPENVVQNFIRALSTGRYEIAAQALSREMQGQATIEALQGLDQALKARHGTYQGQPGGAEQRQGEQASYELLLKTERGATFHPTFTLERSHETGQWEITSFEELRQLAAGEPSGARQGMSPSAQR